eukprot:217447-Chlamydomonas_euryale.AAC.1
MPDAGGGAGRGNGLGGGGGVSCRLKVVVTGVLPTRLLSSSTAWRCLACSCALAPVSRMRVLRSSSSVFWMRSAGH